MQIRNVSFTNSSGSGLILLNIGGNSALINCSFRNSTATNVKVNQSVIYTGGVHIEMSTCAWSILKETPTICENVTAIQNSTLLISSCTFIQNHATGKVQGGGLFIETTGRSTGNHITIKDCCFSSNSAFRGGGACIRMDENVHQNTVQFINTNFISNLSPSMGGGVVIGYYFNKYVPSKNKVIFTGCKFIGNKGEIHAGVSMYSSSSSDQSITENSIQFKNCLWTKNSATSLGAALGVVAIYNKENNNIIANEWFIEILFQNTTFQFNYFSDDLGTSGGVRSGIVHITTIPVKFEGLTTFNDNNGTSLEVVSSTVNFERGSQVMFRNNQASPNGGALNLIRTSAIKVKRNCFFTFRNNTACSGAAIQQHTTDPFDFIHSRKCFIKYVDDTLQKRNLSFVFINNTATCKGFGNSIHVTSIRPCNYTYKIEAGKCQPEFSNGGIFNCVGNFTFLNEFMNRTEITTDAKKIVLTSSENSVLVVPGKEVDLPVYTVDELNNTLPVVYTVLVSNGNILLDKAYEYITYSKSKFFGKPDSKGTLHLTAKSARNQVEAYLEITLSQCPPGYIIDHDEACKCSMLAEHSQRYNCITGCNETSNTALLAQNWWMNFDEGYETRLSLTKSGYSMVIVLKITV